MLSNSRTIRVDIIGNEALHHDKMQAVREAISDLMPSSNLRLEATANIESRKRSPGSTDTDIRCDAKFDGELVAYVIDPLIGTPEESIEYWERYYQWNRANGARYVQLIVDALDQDINMSYMQRYAEVRQYRGDDLDYISFNMTSKDIEPLTAWIKGKFCPPTVTETAQEQPAHGSPVAKHRNPLRGLLAKFNCFGNNSQQQESTPPRATPRSTP